MYFIFLILTIAIMIIMLLAFRGEIMSSPVLVPLMFILCGIVGLFRYSDWYINEYSIDTVIVLESGILSFSIGGILARAFTKQSNRSVSIRRSRIELSLLFLCGAIFLGILYNYLFYRYIARVSSALGYSSTGVSSLIMNFYTAKFYAKNVGDLAAGSTLGLLGYIINVCAVFCMFVFLHNICFRVYKKKDILEIVVVALWLLHSILNSSRGDIIVILSGAVYYVYFFWNMYFGWRKDVNKKILLWGAKVFTVFMIIFVGLTVVTGRIESIRDINPVNYISTYMSGGIRNLDIYISDPKRSDFWGKETFYAINRFLNSRLGNYESYSIGLEFARIHGKQNGNLYTAFRRYYADFGFAGIIVFPMTLGVFFTVLYYKTRKRALSGDMTFSILLLGYLSSTIFYMPIEERFFIADFAPSGLLKILMLYLLYYYYVSKNKKFRITMRHKKIQSAK